MTELFPQSGDLPNQEAKALPQEPENPQSDTEARADHDDREQAGPTAVVAIREAATDFPLRDCSEGGELDGDHRDNDTPWKRESHPLRATGTRFASLGARA